jgi:hypothetical protein
MSVSPRGNEERLTLELEHEIVCQMAALVISTEE